MRIRGIPIRAMPAAQAGQRATCAISRGVRRGGVVSPERSCRSRRDATGTSTVSTSTENPASRARRSMSARISGSRGGYIWNQPAPPRCGPIVSGRCVATVESV